MGLTVWTFPSDGFGEDSRSLPLIEGFQADDPSQPRSLPSIQRKDTVETSELELDRVTSSPVRLHQSLFHPESNLELPVT